jgi:hypothetical protein
MGWKTANNTSNMTPAIGSGSNVAADPNGMLAIVGGTAAAAGNDTVATGSVNAKMVDNPTVDIAMGSTTFGAAAQTTDGSNPLTAADTYAAVSGADLAITKTMTSNTSGNNTAAATSETKYFALDIANWSPPAGSIQVDINKTTRSTNGAYGTVPDGNYASVSAGADATGSNSLAETSTGALAVDNQFSAVQGAAVTAIA